MSVEWQELHDKFTELMREEDGIVQGHATMWAAGFYENGDPGRWELCDEVKESLRERFLTLATESAKLYGCPRGAWPWKQWLHALKLHLERAASKHLRKSGTDYVIQRVAESSAMFCSRLRRQEIEMDALGIEEIMVLESEENLQQVDDKSAVAIQPNSIAPSKSSSPPQKSRESRLQEFINKTHTSVAAISRAAQVDKKNMQQWRHDELPDSSVMSERIERVLSGKTPVA